MTTARVLLARSAGLARGLLRLPVARLGSSQVFARRLLRGAEGLERGLGRGLRTTGIAELRARDLLPPAVRRDDERTRAGAERVVLLLMLGLERQASDLRLELAHDVGHAGQVVERPGQPAGRLVALDLEALDAGGLLEQLAPLLGPQREGGVDRPLADDHQLVRAQPALAEQLDHVAQPRARAVDQVLAVAGPVGAPADR